MIRHDKEDPSVGKPQKTSVKAPKWRRRLKTTLCMMLILALSVGAFVGVLCYRCYKIVSAAPGRLQTHVQPAELGRRVNPFIGTGGFPWVCGNNFPGAMMPFGMVRLGPETASILINKRALNTSGYFYGDDQILGFSHTRLNGTGTTDGGHFLVMPTRDPPEPDLLRQWQSATFSHSEETGLARLLRGPAPGARRARRTHGHPARRCPPLYV